MRIKYLLYTLFFALIIVSKQANAQQLSMDDITNGKISQLTDEQITNYWQKATDAGLSEQDIYTALRQRGVSPADISVLRDRVKLLGLNDKKNKKPGAKSATKVIDFTREKNDTVISPARRNIDQSASPKKLQVYGTDFFNQLDTRFEPNFSLATPKNYILGPGDQLDVVLSGLNETDAEPKIGPDGYIQVPHAGLVQVNGLTMEQATDVIKSKMAKVYPAIKTGETKLVVALGNTRRISVTVNGEINTPGTYTFSSFAYFFNVLYNSGGPNDNGSLRDIQLIRNNKVIKTLDFYKWLQSGLQEDNIRLEDQDVIHFPVYKKRVSITGEVKRPAIYELKDGETLQDLINYAGGYTDIAFKGTANIDRINATGHELGTVNANMLANTIPGNGDLVTIGAVTNRYTNRVVLEGAVIFAGPYELTAGLTLSQLLNKAQGLAPEAYMESGIIKRTMPNLEKISVPFVPADIVNGKNDVPLMREDTVVVLDRKAFTPNQIITVAGFVNKPNVFTYRKGLKLTDVIALSGGFTDEAADHRVTLSRIIPNQSDVVSNQLVQSFTINVDSLTAAHKDYELQPKDYIYVNRLVNYRSLGTVSVKGEVVFPADYAVQRRDETAMDFLRRAGGVTPYGSLENAQVYRKGVRVNLDLASTSPHDSITNRKMILLPGDSIYVPRVISIVEVAGAVNNPQFISYNGRSFKYYINAVGGITQNARLKGAFIKYPDGLNRPVRHFLFFRNYPTVKPGSKIIVPEKAPDTGIKLSIGDIGGIATALTAIVSIFAILHK